MVGLSSVNRTGQATGSSGQDTLWELYIIRSLPGEPTLQLPCCLQKGPLGIFGRQRKRRCINKFGYCIEFKDS